MVDYCFLRNIPLHFSSYFIIRIIRGSVSSSNFVSLLLETHTMYCINEKEDMASKEDTDTNDYNITLDKQDTVTVNNGRSH